MSLIDFIFPEQAQALHLGELAEVGKGIQRYQASKDAEEISNKSRLRGVDRRIEKLENDVALLTMLNVVLIKKYIQESGKSLSELQNEINQVDASDGVMDGGLDSTELRKIIGLPLQEKADALDPKKCPDCDRIISNSLSRCLYCGFIKG